MDEEATPVVEDWPTGLRDYSVYRNGAYKNGRGEARENAMHDRLAEILDGQGYECEVRPSYPRSGSESDLLVRGNGLRAAWVEVKGAWRNLFANEDKDCRIRRRENRSFGPHLERAAKDLDKLYHEVGPEHASHVVFY